jgi:hypothetical protein
MIAIQDKVVSASNCKKYILKDLNITNDICIHYQDKLETIQYIMSACSALAQGEYTHRHNQVAKIVHQELAIKCGLLKTPPVARYKCEPQPVLEKSNYKPYHDRSIITDRTIHKNRPDIVILDKTTKQAYLIYAAILKRDNLHSTISAKLQKYTDLKEEVIRIWKM